MLRAMWSGVPEPRTFLDGHADVKRRIQPTSLLRILTNSPTHTVVRVPYPLTMYHRGLDGRVDDPEAGWKGRGLWVNYGNDPVKYVETEIGYVNHIQLRPDPLAY